MTTTKPAMTPGGSSNTSPPVEQQKKTAKPSKCPVCGKNGVTRWGHFHVKGGVIQRYRCKYCAHVWNDPTVKKSHN